MNKFSIAAIEGGKFAIQHRYYDAAVLRAVYNTGSKELSYTLLPVVTIMGKDYLAHFKNGLTRILEGESLEDALLFLEERVSEMKATLMGDHSTRITWNGVDAFTIFPCHEGESNRPFLVLTLEYKEIYHRVQTLPGAEPVELKKPKGDITHKVMLTNGMNLGLEEWNEF